MTDNAINAALNEVFGVTVLDFVDAETVRNTFARHGLALVPAGESAAGAARDMRDEAAKALNRLDAGGDCEHNRGTEPDTGAGLCSLEDRDGYCICGEVNDVLSRAQAVIRALPIPAPQPDQREAAMRSADEIRQALADLTAQLAPWLATAAGLPAVVKTIGECADLHTAQRKALAALSPSKPQEPNDAGN